MRYHEVLYKYKGSNEHAPSYICEMIELYKPAKPLRSGSQSMLVPKNKAKGYGGRNFSYAAATLWNDLYSVDLKRVETVSSLKSGLKTYFFKQYFDKKYLSLRFFLCTVYVYRIIMLLTFQSSNFNICAYLRFKTCIS